MTTAFLRRQSRDQPDARRLSFGPGYEVSRHNESSSRRHSLWNPLTIDQEEYNRAKFDVDEIRRNVFGPRLCELHIGGVDSSVCRPTTASARRSVIWSRERRLYESQTKQNDESFNKRPYMRHHYPEIGKHYPGTWKVVNAYELDQIVDRLSRPTSLSTIRAQSAPCASATRAKSAPASAPGRLKCKITIESPDEY